MNQRKNTNARRVVCITKVKPPLRSVKLGAVPTKAVIWILPNIQ